jgi:hypothetical protein
MYSSKKGAWAPSHVKADRLTTSATAPALLEDMAAFYDNRHSAGLTAQVRSARHSSFGIEAVGFAKLAEPVRNARSTSTSNCFAAATRSR